MTGDAPAARLLSRAQRAAARLAALLAGYTVVMELGAGWGLPQVATSPPGILLGVLLTAALVASAVAPLVEPGPGGAARAASVLVRGGLALVLLGLPLSLVARAERVFAAAEGDPGPGDALAGAGIRRFGAVAIAPRGENALLAKDVAITAELEDGSTRRIGLWPPTRLGAWRFAVLRYGFAPGVDWRDERGAAIVRGYQLLGTSPKSAEEAALVTWTPEPSVMLGVGYYPPRVEDLLAAPSARSHLFLRLQSATLGGTRRPVADPSAYRWLADGKAQDPEWFAQVLQDGRVAWSGTLRGGETASFPAGSLRVVPELRFWVELQAVRDPYLYLAAAGALALVSGLIARIFLRSRSHR
jgi:hypothetical protein